MNVTGSILVTYKVLCKADVNKTVSVQELLANEKVAKAIKSEFAKGFRNIGLLEEGENSAIKIETSKELHTFEIQKDDFADILVLAEENAASKKLLKKECERIELVNIETL